MSLTAEMQMIAAPAAEHDHPQVAVARILEPAYDVAGNSFDYALNDVPRTVAVDQGQRSGPPYR